MNAKFLGVGSAFNYKLDCTSLYFKENGTLFIIDVGEKIASKVIALNLLKDYDVKKVCIIITHMHIDHIGALEPLLTYLDVFTNLHDVTLVYPRKKELMKFLLDIGYDKKVKVLDKMNNEVDGVRIRVVNQVHFVNSFGYFIYGKENKFFYSGDTSKFYFGALDELKKGQIDMIYHEVASKSSSFHIGLDDLNKKIAEKYRSKVTLMHFEDDELIEKVKECGYIAAEQMEVE